MQEFTYKIRHLEQIVTVRTKCQILFSGKDKKTYLSMSSSDSCIQHAQNVKRSRTFTYFCMFNKVVNSIVATKYQTTFSPRIG